MFGGVQIIEDYNMVEMTEDWSHVRSRGRAIRRRRKGHCQNIKFVRTPKKEAISIDGGRTLIMHPAMAHALRVELTRRGLNKC